MITLPSRSFSSQCRAIVCIKIYTPWVKSKFNDFFNYSDVWSRNVRWLSFIFSTFYSSGNFVGLIHSWKWVAYLSFFCRRLLFSIAPICKTLIQQSFELWLFKYRAGLITGQSEWKTFSRDFYYGCVYFLSKKFNFQVILTWHNIIIVRNL